MSYYIVGGQRSVGNMLI